MIMRKFAAPAVAAALMLTACSSDDGRDAGESTTLPATTAIAPTTTSTTPAASTTTAQPEPPSTTVPWEPLPTTFPAPTDPACTSLDTGALLVTVDCVDADLATAPFIDVDETRESTDPATGVTVSYRYINGGFTDTDVRFSYYFPAAADYAGRFFQSTYPTVTQEDAQPATIAFAISNGAYVVSSNNGGGVAASPTLGGYRANAAAAKFSRVIAAELYGADAPVRGYVYGASGGAYQTLAAAENTTGVWAGSVPMVPGVPNSIPSFMSVQVLALRLLADDWPAIVDALEPGGSGDPYATLDPDERAILEQATRLGHPLRGWWQYETLRGGAFALVVPAVSGVDGTYGEDFFNLPGYEGQDPAVQAARVQFETTIESVADGQLTLADAPDGFLLFADLVVSSGAAAGSTIAAAGVEGTTVTLPDDPDPAVIDALAAGDRVLVDNSFYLALSYYHRHQVPSPDQYGWNQFRDAGGNPVPTQRSILVGEVLSQAFGGVATGRFNGHMIMLSSTLDVQAFPWAADWYHSQARAAHGDRLDDRYRLWYMDNADHDDPRATAAQAHIVSYRPELEQALLDLDAWVLDGSAPPASSTYRITDDNQVELSPTAAERGGVQPVPALTVASGEGCAGADGVDRADVGVGAPVSFALDAAVPPGAGEIVRVEWDFEGTGDFPDATTLDEPSSGIEICETHAYDQPGTYFAVARVTSHRDGRTDATFQLIQNLARVRVVVE